jgi:NitT/TauT family transport system ATP-binding protein
LTPDVSAAAGPLPAAAPDVTGAPAGAGDAPSAPAVGPSVARSEAPGGASGAASGAASAVAPAVALRGVGKVYGSARNAVVALERIDLAVAPGEFVCVVGASGCGKSTLLNLVAGLDEPTAGTVDVAGRTALMFQDAALFPWLTVAGNVDVTLKLRKVPKDERRRRVAHLLELVGLEAFAKRQPHELSGGMRQRVALARAFAQDADVLLMDEPFGALDAMTRDVMHDELENLWRSQNLTVLFVTHNVREAARLGDRIVVLSSRPGRVTSDVEVDNPRPRRIDSPEVSTLAADVTDLLRQEVRRHAEPR